MFLILCLSEALGRGSNALLLFYLIPRLCVDKLHSFESYLFFQVLAFGGRAWLDEVNMIMTRVMDPYLVLQYENLYSPRPLAIP